MHLIGHEVMPNKVKMAIAMARWKFRIVLIELGLMARIASGRSEQYGIWTMPPSSRTKRRSFVERFCSVERGAELDRQR